MRYLTLTLMLLCCTSCQHTGNYSHLDETDRTNHLAPVNLGLSDFEGTLYFFQTTQAALDDAPRWARGADFPPLSPRKARVAALREVERIRPDVSKWNMESISLLQFDNGKDECWVYSVRFSRGDVPVTGLPPYLDVPVLMDGAVV